MSWDIVIFNLRRKITSPEEIDEDMLIPADFAGVFRERFKNIKAYDNRNSVEEEDFAIDYLEDDEPVSNTLLHLYGEKAIYPLVDLAIKNGWQIFDTGLGEMIDLDDPSRNGYHNFQRYLNQIVNKKI